jgi:hypothetical protein
MMTLMKTTEVMTYDDGLRYLNSALAALQLAYFTSEFKNLGFSMRLSPKQLKQREALAELENDIKNYSETRPDGDSIPPPLVDVLRKWN